MKHIRKYNESTQEFTFIDVVNILQDIIDDVDNKYLVIYSATGNAYYGDDIHIGTTGFMLQLIAA